MSKVDKIELAREMFRKLEARGVCHAAEIARRTFYIEESLSRMRG